MYRLKGPPQKNNLSGNGLILLITDLYVIGYTTREPLSEKRQELG